MVASSRLPDGFVWAGEAVKVEEGAGLGLLFEKRFGATRILRERSTLPIIAICHEYRLSWMVYVASKKQRSSFALRRRAALDWPRYAQIHKSGKGSRLAAGCGQTGHGAVRQADGAVQFRRTVLCGQLHLSAHGRAARRGRVDRLGCNVSVAWLELRRPHGQSRPRGW